MTALAVALALAVLALVAALPLMRSWGWSAGYRAAQAANRELNRAVFTQLTNYERAEVERFDRAHPA